MSFGKDSVNTAKRKEKQKEIARLHEKTFRAWINSHLRKRELTISNLFEDLKDGVMLINILEVLSGQKCPGKYTKSPKMDVHKLENVSIAVEFCKQFFNISIRSQDILEGNQKIILGWIWRMILHFQVAGNQGKDDDSGSAAKAKAAKQKLLEWLQQQTKGYNNVNVSDFQGSWFDGLAFCALVHAFDPSLVDFNTLNKDNAKENLKKAFDLAEKHMDLPALLDPEDICNPDPELRPDEQCFITYLAQFPVAFLGKSGRDLEREKAEAERLKGEADKRKLEEDARKAAEDARRLEEERLKAEEERRRLEEERARLEAERLKSEEDRRRKELEDQDREKQRLEDAKRLNDEQAAREEAERKRLEAERRAKELEDEKRRLEEEEAQRLKEEKKRRKAERLANDKDKEDTERKKREAEEAFEAERKRLEAENAALRKKLRRIGTLEVGVIEARSLKKADHLLGGKSDPYCVLYVERQKEKTRTVKKCLNPKWEAKFEFYVSDSSAVLEVDVFDWNRILADDFLGKVSVPVSQLADGKDTEAWYSLEGKKKTDKVSGEIKLHLLYRLEH